MSKKKDWAVFEEDVQDLLGMDATVASGSKFYDIGDGVHRGHYSDVKYPLLVDCKETKKKSYTLEAAFLHDWEKRSLLQGKIFALPVRFTECEGSDWVVLTTHDFAQIYADSLESKTVEEKDPLKEADRVETLEGIVQELLNIVKNVEDPTQRVEAFNGLEVLQQELGL